MCGRSRRVATRVCVAISTQLEVGASAKQRTAPGWSAIWDGRGLELLSNEIGSEFQVEDTGGKVVTNDELPSFSIETVFRPRRNSGGRIGVQQ